MLSHVLDDWFRDSGHLDPLWAGWDRWSGSGVGDVLGGLASCIIMVAAWFRGVPYITLVRMAVNVGIEVLVGSIPLLGDAFDIAWKANRRNYELLVRHTSNLAVSAGPHLERLGISWRSLASVIRWQCCVAHLLALVGADWRGSCSRMNANVCESRCLKRRSVRYNRKKSGRSAVW